MLDPRKEMSELFEMTDELRRLSLTMMQHYDAQAGDVRDANASEELNKFLSKVKAMQEKVRDCMRAVARQREDGSDGI
jgi:hypothetical protein